MLRFRCSLFIILASLFDLFLCKFVYEAHNLEKTISQDGDRKVSWSDSWSPERLDCSQSTSHKSINDSYCDRMVESLLVLVVGIPDGSVSNPVVSSANNNVANTTPTNPEGVEQDEIPVDPNVVKICCFLTSFKTARETCCQQIRTFCDSALEESNVCECSGSSNSIGGPDVGPYISTGNGDSDWGDTFEGDSAFSRMVSAGYNMLKKVGSQIWENLTSNK